jgi:hypothetical protein
MQRLLTACLTLLFFQSSISFAEGAPELRVSGKLIRPLCTTLFPINQSVTLPAVSLNLLRAGTSPWTEVPLEFRCVENTQVKLRFVAPDLAHDTVTLRTTLAGLGLRLRLRDVDQGQAALDMRLNETLGFTVKDSGVRLNLAARAVMVGDQAPAIGSYQSHLLLTIDYL